MLKSENNTHIVGVDIGGTNVKIGALNTNGEISDVLLLDMVPGEPEFIIDKIAKAAKELNPDFIGVGTAGAVNYKTGLVEAGNLRWRDVPLRAKLAEKTQRPVWVDNDAKAALMAEWHSGACKGARCAVCVTIGTGLGGALLIDGRPWRGDDNTAFELGHIITNAKEYKSGTIEGHLEYYVSGNALARMSGKSAREVVDGVISGDEKSRRVFDALIHELGIGLISVIRLFKPEVIVLGGGICKTGEYLLSGIRSKMAELLPWDEDGYAGEKIRLAVHQNDAGMIGAAVLAKMYLIDN
jgi:glucokinase